MKRAFNLLVVPALLLAWTIAAVIIFVMISHYDFVHIYFLPLQFDILKSLAGVPLGRYFLDLLVALAGASLFSLACVSLGLRLIGARERADAGAIAGGATAFVVGEIALSVVFLSAIVLFELTPLIVSLTLALGVLVGLRPAIAFVRSIPRFHRPDGFRTSETILLVLVVAAMALAMLYTSAILGYDSVVQYFSNAKIMAATHQAVYTYPKDPFPVSSFHSSILYTALIELFGDQAARMLSWFNGLAIMLLGLAIGGQVGATPKARLWFPVLMLSSTAFVDLLGDGKVELVSSAPLLAAVFWMLRSVKQPTGSGFALIGLLLGFAMIARPYNLFLAPLFVTAFYGIHLLRQRRAGGASFRELLAPGIWIFPPLLAMGAFHLLQNWLWLGNALAPLYSGTRLSAGDWQWQFSPKLLNTYRLIYPIVASFANSPQSLGNITPLFVGFMPFLLLKKVRQWIAERPMLMWLGIAALAVLIPWLVLFFTVVEIRYILFLWVVFLLVAAQVMDAAASQGRGPVQSLMVPIAAVLLIYMGTRTIAISLETYAPVDTDGQANCRGLAFCTFLEPVNRSAAPGERVFVINAYRYYLRPDLFACAARAEEYASFESLAKSRSPDFWSELYRAGFRYVTYEENYATFHAYFGALPSAELAPAWLHVTELYAEPDGGEKVFRLEADNAPLPAKSTCEQDPAGVWRIVRAAPGE